jgi:putative salt-induced outer membrane protein YdiY
MQHKYSLSLVAALAVFGATASSRADDAINVATATNHWESAAAAGFTLTRGNSDTFLGTLSLGTARKWEHSEFTMGADGTYGTTKISESNPTPPPANREVTQTTAQSLHGFIQDNWLFTDRFYAYGRLEGLHDEVADIHYRLSLSPGVGYYFVKNKALDVSGEVGPGYIIQRLDHHNESYATLRLSEKLHYAISDRARLWETVEFLPQVDKFNNYIVNFEIGVESDLSASKKLALRLYLDDTYNNQPAPGRQKNDAKLVGALAYKF